MSRRAPDPERGTGCLFGVGDAGALRDAVVWMHENPRARARSAAIGRAACAEMFDADRMVAALETVYERSLRPPGG